MRKIESNYIRKLYLNPFFKYFYTFIFYHYIMPNLWEIMEICRTQQSTIDWLIENDIFYNTSTGNRILLCKNGNQMKLVNSRYKGLLWQCPKRSCCNRSKKTLRSDSFFYNYKIPINAVVLVIYLFITKCKKTQIEEMTNLDHKTIANIISGIYDLMECELTEEDVQIGKKKYIKILSIY